MPRRLPEALKYHPLSFSIFYSAQVSSFFATCRNLRGFALCSGLDILDTIEYRQLVAWEDIYRIVWAWFSADDLHE